MHHSLTHQCSLSSLPLLLSMSQSTHGSTQMVHNGKFTLWGQSMYLLTNLLWDNILDAYVVELVFAHCLHWRAR
jgi:hypothetical protein